MAYNNIESALALQCLRAPLHPNPIITQEKCLNRLQVKYRSYFVEFNVHEGAVMLPTLFCDDFGNEVTRFVDLIDSNGNQFEVLLDKVNGNLYFTRGWGALRDFYDIRVGGWILLMYTAIGRFGMILQDRLHRVIAPPTFVPPMKFIIDMSTVPSHFVDNLPESAELLSYAHPPGCFNLTHDKKLTHSDITSGFLMLPYDEFGKHAFDEVMDSIKLVDDCGNTWKCTLIYLTFPYKFFKIGGEWGRLVGARRLLTGDPIRVGVPLNSESQSLYLMLDC